MNFTDTKGLLECAACINGQVNDMRSTCLKCDIGKYFNTSMCIDCPLGQYQNTRGKDKCNECTGGWIPNEKRRDCIKPPWPFPEECQNNEYLNDTAPLKQNWTCKLCPNGADCSNATASLTTLMSEKGWWRIPDEYGPGDILFARCPFPQDCLAAKPNEPKCVNTTTQDLCSRCKVGYDRISSRCELCRENEIGLRVALMMGLVVLFVFLLYRSRKFLLKKWRKYKVAVKDASLATKVIISFLQVSVSKVNMHFNLFIQLKRADIFLFFFFRCRCLYHQC